MKTKRIIFMGTPHYATTIFKKLLDQEYNIVALFTQPDKKIGRKQLLTPPDIKKYCLNNNISIPIYQPHSIKDNVNIIKVIKDLKPNFIIVAAYGQILPSNILSISPCINLHTSLLPHYRGASPIQQSILNNDKYSGITAILMDKGMDSGDILGFRYICIPKDMDSEKLFIELSILASEFTIYILSNFEKLQPKKQNLLQVSYCKKIKKIDGIVDFISADKVYQKFKAYIDWPGIFLESGLKIKDCNILESSSKNIKGKILSINDNSIDIGCSSGVIRIYSLQPPSKNIIKATDYIRGKRLNIGDIISTNK
jgi:methionyl-tRNA formyltransferase